MPKPQLKNRVRLKFSPQSRKRLSILSLSNEELRDEINKTFADNPFLEENGNIENSQTLEKVSYDKFSYQRSLPESLSDSQTKIENIESSKETLQEYLESQLKFMIHSPRLLDLAMKIISTLDKRGFVSTEHKKTAKDFGFSSDELKKVLNCFQQLDILGAGAEDIWQSLGWQAKKKYPKDFLLLDVISILRKISEDFSEDLEELSRSIVEMLHLNKEIVSEKLKKLSALNIYPAVNFSENKTNNYVYPDIIFHERKEKIVSQVDSYYISGAALNKKLYDEFTKAEKNSLWNEKFKDAGSFLADIQYRSEKLAHLAAFLIEKEETFFKHGTAALVPLNLKDAADELKIHISTVSRLIKDKYFQCSFGVLPLKIFFTTKIKTVTGGAKSIYQLKEALSEIIMNENKENPHSDEKISFLLEKKGYKLRRRTVAKYRKLLHIPSTKKRKA